MNVILLTGFVGLILVGLAIAFFFYTRSCSEGSCSERESLLPLEEEKVVVHQSRSVNRNADGSS